MIRSLALVFTAGILVFILFNRFDWKENTVFQWDAAGYYRYLPAIVIYQDLGKFDFTRGIDSKYGITKGVEFYALHPQPQTGKRLNKYSVGVSLFETPAFFLAHGFTLLGNKYPADGFSAYYRLFVSIGNVFWVLLGLWLIAQLLRRYYSDWIVAMVVVLVMFGTNLYHYTVWEVGMSHPYSFFLLSVMLDLSDRLYRKGQRAPLIWLGVVYGLLLITRPTNAIALVIPLFWTVDSFPSFRHRIQFFRKHLKTLIFATAICIAICMLQCAYWKFASGHWIYYSYEGEGFDFAHPEILNGLISFRKGWFLYTPLAAFAILGLFALHKKQPGNSLLITLYILVSVYIVFSWRQWYYGGGFGSRPMVENYAVLSLPLAALLDWASTSLKKIRVTVCSLLILCVALNLWQTYQYNICVIPFDGNTASYYKRVFFKLSKTEEDERIYHSLTD